MFLQFLLEILHVVNYKKQRQANLLLIAASILVLLSIGILFYFGFVYVTARFGFQNALIGLMLIFITLAVLLFVIARNIKKDTASISPSEVLSKIEPLFSNQNIKQTYEEYKPQIMLGLTVLTLISIAKILKNK